MSMSGFPLVALAFRRGWERVTVSFCSDFEVLGSTVRGLEQRLEVRGWRLEVGLVGREE